jgi:type IV pilus assembly protein PilA
MPGSGTIPPPYAGTPQTSGKAIGSLICGIINVFPLFIVAIILGHLALSDIKKSAGRLTGNGIAIAGLILGYLGIVFIPIILIIAAIAIPNLLRARIAANEASAAASVRTLFQAEMMYSQSHADSGFTCNLSDLSSSGLIDGRLASGEKLGYRFELQNCAAEGDSGAAKKIQIVASPVTHNTTGVRAFCTDQEGVIRVDTRGSAEDCVASGSTLE